jgi:hypothetical protein
MDRHRTRTPPANESTCERRCRSLEREVAGLRRELAHLQALAGEVLAAETWDHEVYGRIPRAGWLLIDRDSWARMMAAVDELDAWRPWSA